MPSPKTVLALKSAGSIPSHLKLNTLADLLNAGILVFTLALNLSAQKKRSWQAYLRAGALAICRFLSNRPLDKILIAEIINIGAEFDKYLKRTATPALRCRYVTQHHLLLTFARALHCCPEMFSVEEAWKRLPLSTRGIGKLIAALIRQGLLPDQVTERHLTAWTKIDSDGKSTAAHRRKCIWELKFRIRKAGDHASFPRLDLGPAYSRYSIGVRNMHPVVRAALNRIEARLADRNKRGLARKNPTTRRVFIRNAERLYGYCINIRHMPRNIGLKKMFSREVVSDFARWLHESRGWKRATLGITLSSFHSGLSLSLYPCFRYGDLSWMVALVKEFPRERQSEKEARDSAKAFEYDYDALAVIPGIIRDKWKSSPDLTLEARGWLIHDCLLMLWLLTAPWPPACLRRCRISGKSPNLVRLRSPRTGQTAEKDAGDKCIPESTPPSGWRFRLSAKEVPLGHAAHGPFPIRLVPLLELYLKHRKHLLQGRRTSTLFLDRTGKEMQPLTLFRLVGDITEDFVGKRVPPSAFRPIFAYHWLQHHPGDYTNLASILWEGLPAIKLRFDREYRMSRRARILARRTKRN